MYDKTSNNCRGRKNKGKEKGKNDFWIEFKRKMWEEGEEDKVKVK